MPYNAVRELEERIAAWSGARFGVAVESCSAALFLSCVYKKVGYCTVPSRTYPSVPCSILNAGGTVGFRDEAWAGTYELAPWGIIDGALRFRPGMYQGGLHCLSFHIKKHLPIGRGGMILTDDEEAYRWLKRARFDGRDEVPLLEDDFTMTGWNMHLQPEQASRGLQLFDLVKDRDLPDLDVAAQGYPDLSQFAVYHNASRG
jgi:dTDP-4-amino-4,6-dideoxygalactose transaminase